MNIADTQDDLEREYRVLYWERNELQIVRPDSPEPFEVDKAIVLRDIRMTAIRRELGYTPEA